MLLGVGLEPVTGGFEEVFTRKTLTNPTSVIFIPKKKS